MNLPNFLTLTRVALSLLFILFLCRADAVSVATAFGLFLIASITDYWDGALARRNNEVTQFGRLMDPIADKMLTLSAFFGFAFLRLVDPWTVAVVLVRDALVTFLRLTMPVSGDKQSARNSGKQKTFLQMAYIMLVLLYLAIRHTAFWAADWNGPALAGIRAGMFLVVAVTVLSGGRYIYKVTKG